MNILTASTSRRRNSPPRVVDRAFVPEGVIPALKASGSTLANGKDRSRASAFQVGHELHRRLASQSKSTSWVARAPCVIHARQPSTRRRLAQGFCRWTSSRAAPGRHPTPVTAFRKPHESIPYRGCVSRRKACFAAGSSSRYLMASTSASTCRRRIGLAASRAWVLDRSFAASMAFAALSEMGENSFTVQF